MVYQMVEMGAALKELRLVDEKVAWKVPEKDTTTVVLKEIASAA